MKTIYTPTQAEKLINKYLKFEEAEIVQINEGCLGMGDWILTAKGKKTVIIKEVFINAWSSGQSIRMYNKTPKKYEKYLDR